MTKEVTIKSKSGKQVVIISRTSVGVTIATIERQARVSLHIFEECIPEIVKALREMGLIEEAYEDEPVLDIDTDDYFDFEHA